MDFLVPTALFLAGFLVALLAGRSMRLRRESKVLRRLPVQEGAVRLDLLAREPDQATERAAGPDAPAAGLPQSGGGGGQRRPRAR